MITRVGFVVPSAARIHAAMMGEEAAEARPVEVWAGRFGVVWGISLQDLAVYMGWPLPIVGVSLRRLTAAGLATSTDDDWPLYTIHGIEP